MMGSTIPLQSIRVGRPTHAGAIIQLHICHTLPTPMQASIVCLVDASHLSGLP
jgi:hypothetical protein